jgi:hypothetical protein
MTIRIRHATGAALLGGLALLQGCGEKPAGPAASKERIYVADLAGGAKACDAPRLLPDAGKTTGAAIKLGNDGGWCGLYVHQDGPKPFDAGLLTARPEHGSVTIHTVGDNTRIDYVPDRAYTGTDSFTVRLLPGAAVLQVAVTVTAP